MEIEAREANNQATEFVERLLSLFAGRGEVGTVDAVAPLAKSVFGNDAALRIERSESRPGAEDVASE
ncbi:hypothetical protein V5P93_004296 [Actinokineospora auranticolor]|uniref:hypothetical protein n=1 Tax=Actinokineospora auranticolor TaxID=155976 RepID=UPI0011B057CD|nr:hypothetical protein [Actinokineospora auranticolor]